jgi:excisionase family DNA binding protein
MLLTVAEAADRLKISRWMLYKLIRSQQLRTITIGARRLVPSVEIDAFLAQRQEAQS